MRVAMGWMLVTCVAVTAGCGGGPMVKGKELANCLRRHPNYYISTKSNDLDDAERTATDLGITLDTPGNKVAIVVDKSGAEAKIHQRWYAGAVKTALLPFRGLLERKRNVVLFWTSRPNPHERAAADACLVSSH